MTVLMLCAFNRWIVRI